MRLVAFICSLLCALLCVDMIEYFLFHFLFVLASASGAAPSVQKHFPLVHARAPPRKVLSSLQSLANSSTGLAPLSFHWRVDGSADVYLTLLAEYLTFMVPEMTPQLTDSSLTPSENILTSLLLKSNSPLWSRTELAMKYSAFFTGVLVEFWLNSYSYRLDSHGVPRAEPSFILPSIDFLQALQVASRHFSNVFALSLAAAPAAAVDPAYIKVATDAFALFRLSVYRYLRVALAVWPVDASLTLLVDFWLSLISPWFHLDPQICPKQLPLDDSSPSFQPAWKPFIIASFYLYQSIYVQFFTFASDAFEGFLASGECEDVNEAVSKLSALISCLIEVMNPLLSVAATLQELEIEVAKSSSFMRFSSPTAAELQQQLRVLEPETFKATQIFGSEMIDSLIRMLSCMEALVLSILKRFQQVQHDDEIGDSAPVLTKRELFTQVLENSQVPQNVKSLAKWTLQVENDFAVVFGLKTEDCTVPASKPLPMLRRKNCWMPQDAKTHLRHKMTAKAQLPGLANDDVVRSYESAILVALMKLLSRHLTVLIRSYVFKPIEERWNVRIPKMFWEMEVNLRFFAAYPNLLFSIVVFMVARIILKFM